MFCISAEYVFVYRIIVDKRMKNDCEIQEGGYLWKLCVENMTHNTKEK